MSSVVLVTGMILLGPALGTGEATRGGAGSHPDAVLYELTEHAVLTDEFRLATSALEGSARRGSPLCPEGLQEYAKALFAMVGVHVKVDPRCAVVAIGESRISLDDFGGAISGNFWIVVNSDATNLADAQELVIMNGTFAGKIQVMDAEGHIIAILPGSTFTPTSVLPGFPLPPAASFTGKFRLPFKVHHIAVYENDRGRPVPVLPGERALGDPTVRVEIDFD
ncbi:MAG: hypothetical protein ACREK4_18850 [Candidatus Rokuibacteriota bacterium]